MSALAQEWHDEQRQEWLDARDEQEFHAHPQGCTCTPCARDAAGREEQR